MAREESHRFAASSHVLEWLASLAQIEELACRLKRNLEGPLTEKKHFVSYNYTREFPSMHFIFKWSMLSLTDKIPEFRILRAKLFSSVGVIKTVLQK